jgi:ribosomal protein S18 acetylase RimI-like enzyme
MNLYFDSYSEKYSSKILQFRSGTVTVDEYLIEEAGELHELCAARTRLYFDANSDLVGYFTLALNTLTLSEVIRRDWGLQGQRNYSALHIWYFGVKQECKRLGYGRRMMTDIIHIARNFSVDIGCRCLLVEVDQNNTEANYFYKDMDFVIDVEDYPYNHMVLRIAPYSEEELEMMQE